MRFAVYFFDDYTEQWWADPPLRRFAMRVERWIIARADKIIVTNEMMQQEIRHRYARMSEIVRNPAAHGEIPALMESYPAQAHEVRLVFTGAVYHLNYDILRAIISGLATIQEIKHRLHIYTAQDRAQLEAEGLVGPHVEIHSHVTPQQAKLVPRLIGKIRNAVKDISLFDEDTADAEVVVAVFDPRGGRSAIQAEAPAQTLQR